MTASLNKRVSRVETRAEDAHLATLRQTIADLEQRKVELLADLTTLEAAIAAMQQHTRRQKAPESRRSDPS